MFDINYSRFRNLLKIKLMSCLSKIFFQINLWTCIGGDFSSCSICFSYSFIYRLLPIPFTQIYVVNVVAFERIMSNICVKFLLISDLLKTEQFQNLLKI